MHTSQQFNFDLKKFKKRVNNSTVNEIAKEKRDKVDENEDSKIKAKVNKSKQKCPYCHSLYLTKNNLEVHIESKHKNAKLFRCGRCRYTIDNYSAFYSHIRKHLRPYKCIVCEEKFTSESQVQTHHLEDHKKRVVKCKNCNLKMTRTAFGRKPKRKNIVKVKN